MIFFPQHPTQQLPLLLYGLCTYMISVNNGHIPVANGLVDNSHPMEHLGYSPEVGFFPK